VALLTFLPLLGGVCDSTRSVPCVISFISFISFKFELFLILIIFSLFVVVCFFSGRSVNSGGDRPVLVSIISSHHIVKCLSLQETAEGASLLCGWSVPQCWWWCLREDPVSHFTGLPVVFQDQWRARMVMSGFYPFNHLMELLNLLCSVVRFCFKFMSEPWVEHGQYVSDDELPSFQ